MTWRSLYACSNGWRGLLPGCFETLELPSSATPEPSFSTACLVDGRDLGWAAAAADASELLVIVSGPLVQASPRARVAVAHFRAASHPGLRPADELTLPAGGRLQDGAVAAEVEVAFGSVWAAWL